MTGRLPAQTLVEGILRVILVLLVLVLLGLATDAIFRIHPYLEPPWSWTGIVPISLGVGLEALGTRALSKYGAGSPHPRDPPKHLVVDGPYAYSRNPLYLARFWILFGFSLLFGSEGILAMLVGLVLFVEFVLLPREERRLAGKYGERYTQYSLKVGRWILRIRTRRGI